VDITYVPVARGWMYLAALDEALARHGVPQIHNNVSVKLGASGGACGGWLQSPHECTTTSNHIC
jgi:hypothetical protein